MYATPSHAPIIFAPLSLVSGTIYTEYIYTHNIDCGMCGTPIFAAKFRVRVILAGVRLRLYILQVDADGLRHPGPAKCIPYFRGIISST